MISANHCWPTDLTWPRNCLNLSFSKLVNFDRTCLPLKWTILSAPFMCVSINLLFDIDMQSTFPRTRAVLAEIDGAIFNWSLLLGQLIHGARNATITIILFDLTANCKPKNWCSKRNWKHWNLFRATFKLTWLWAQLLSALRPNSSYSNWPMDWSNVCRTSETSSNQQSNLQIFEELIRIEN